ncbi:FABP family protein [Methyloterricola oryzae]|uniref:FABP family protein n=1 Tax=Methyloterricola oryzae TaxID=1495050 RepID=UPI0009E449E8|nr:heme-binding beta-barrel domain-containing protein [Methyloterricola oryzae]
MSDKLMDDIYTEPADVDPDTLRNLGPLTPLAGVWEGLRGTDVHPDAEGPVEDTYLERYDLQPIDPQTNGPQLLYGLRYHVHVTRPGAIETFHDQVGYWLWEPATERVIQTLAIPRGQIAMAAGHSKPDARRFDLSCDAESPYWGTCSNPFLHQAFRTVRFTITVIVHDDGTWSYEQDTVLRIQGRDDEFHHTDRNTLRRIAAPTPNPLMRNPG